MARISDNVIAGMYAREFIAITKSDSTVYDPPLMGIYVGGAGNVAALGVDDSVAVTFTAPPVGTIIPGLFQKVMSTNTTATVLVGLVSPVTS